MKEIIIAKGFHVISLTLENMKVLQSIYLHVPLRKEFPSPIASNSLTKILNSFYCSPSSQYYCSCLLRYFYWVNNKTLTQSSTIPQLLDHRKTSNIPCIHFIWRYFAKIQYTLLLICPNRKFSLFDFTIKFISNAITIFTV